jgi:hypothetical protein
MELRKSPRFPVLLPISFSKDGLAGEGMIVNLSQEGCSIGCDEDVKQGSYLSLNISLPDEASPLVIDRAVVRWSMQRAFGLEFIRMESEQKERLGRLVKALEAKPNL